MVIRFSVWCSCRASEAKLEVRNRGREEKIKQKQGKTGKNKAKNDVILIIFSDFPHHILLGKVERKIKKINLN